MTVDPNGEVGFNQPLNAAEAGYDAGFRGATLWSCNFRNEARITWLKQYELGWKEKERRERLLANNPEWRNR